MSPASLAPLKQAVVTAASKFYMPAEWVKHRRCWMLWPVNPGNWRNNAGPAQHAFLTIATSIARFEPVTIGVAANHLKDAQSKLESFLREQAQTAAQRNIDMEMICMESDDLWMRDTGPTFVYHYPHGSDKELIGMDWKFNGWGGLINELNHDHHVAREVCRYTNVPSLHTESFVLEGGSIHTDGEGTILTTEECLLNINRNPHLTKSEIEQYLLQYLGGEKVIWLPRGLVGDHDTDGHIDNICCFTKPGQVLLAWSDDPNDLQYEICREAMAIFAQEKDAKGRTIEVVKLPIPPMLFLTQEECEGLEDIDSDKKNEEGLLRAPGTRLAASYVNFYLANEGIVAPAYHPDTDGIAKAVLETAFPGREVVLVPGREILVGGGNIHCITQQEPLLH